MMAQLNFKFKKNEDPRIREFAQNQGNISESIRRLIVLHVTKYGTGDLFDTLMGTRVEPDSPKKTSDERDIPDCYRE